MSKSFEQSTRALSKAVAATEQMQKAAREFLVAQSAWAEAFTAWASNDTNEMIKDTYVESMPLWEVWAAEQSEFIAQSRSFVYYEMGTLMGAAQDFMQATKETDKARSALKKKQDAAAKGGAKSAQNEAGLPAAKQALEKAKLNEARLRDKFTRLKHVVVKAGLFQMTGSYVKMTDVGSHLFNAMNQLASMMPDEVSEDNLQSINLAEIKGVVSDAMTQLPQAQTNHRYPGIFLHKKAEKFGKEKKRFFQLEPAPGTDGSVFCYYQDVLRGLPYMKKGEIVINSETEVDTNGREILLRTPNRKWVLISKTAEEARWWSGLLVKAKHGIPDHAVMKPCSVEESNIQDINDARAHSSIQMSPSSGASAAEDAGERFVVNNEFKSEEGEGTLNLQVGDVVVVGEKGDDWWFAATLDGSSDGWCPAIFLDPVGAESSASAPSAAAAATDSNATWDTTPASDEQPEGRYVRAAYDNEGAEEDELSFQEGDEIYQIQDSDEYGWSRGILNGVEGIYPAAYVEEISN